MLIHPISICVLFLSALHAPLAAGEKPSVPRKAATDYILSSESIQHANFEDIMNALEAEDATIRRAAQDLFLSKQEHITDSERMTRDLLSLKLQGYLASANDSNRAERTRKVEEALALMGLEHNEPSAWQSLISPHTNAAGVAAYSVADALYQRHGATKEADALTGTTPQAVFNKEDNNFGGQNPLNQMGFPSLSTSAAIARNIVKASYGLGAFAPTLAKSKRIKNLLGIPDGSQQPFHAGIRGLGVANLLAQAAALGYGASSKNTKLNAHEARLLSYANRRYGVMPEIERYKRFFKTTADLRLALQVGGQAILPLLALLVWHGKKKGANAALISGNITGLIDSALTIWQKHRQKRMIKQLKSIMPALEEELENNPPTETEKASDVTMSDAFDLGALMNGGFSEAPDTPEEQ